MGLVKCVDCGKYLSDKARACPQCGCPISAILNSINESAVTEHNLPTGIYIQTISTADTSDNNICNECQNDSNCLSNQDNIDVKIVNDNGNEKDIDNALDSEHANTGFTSEQSGCTNITSDNIKQVFTPKNQNQVKHKMTSYIAILLLIVLATYGIYHFGSIKLNNTSTQDDKLYPVCINSKWGFIDYNLKVIIKPEYDKVTVFNKGTAFVEKKIDDATSLQGFINTSGNYTIGPVTINNYYNINSQGSGLTDLPHVLDNHLIISKLNNSTNQYKYALIKANDLIKIASNKQLSANFKYDEIERIAPGIFVAKLSNADRESVRMINSDGETILPAEYKYISRVDSQTIKATKDNDDIIFVDKSGKETFKLDSKYTYAFTLDDGYYVVKDKSNDKYGLINRKNEIIINPMYDGLLRIGETHLVYGQHNTIGYLDKHGKELTPAIYESNGSISSDIKFTDNKLCVRKNNKCGYIDTDGKLVIEPTYDDVYPFSNEVARYKDGKKYGYIDKKGKIIIQASFYNASDFNNGIAGVTFNNVLYVDAPKGMYEKLIDKNGNVLNKVDFTYVVVPTEAKKYEDESIDETL